MTQNAYPCPACGGAGYFVHDKRKSANKHAADRSKERIEVCKKCNGQGVINGY